MIIEVYAYEEAPKSYNASIFLVGPTPRTNEVTSWRSEALKCLKKIYYHQKINIAVFIPEHRSHIYNFDYLKQVEWEKQYLNMADVIFAWVPRNMNTSLQGLTTHVEFGQYIESGKLFYGRPDNAENIKYLDWMYTDITGREAVNTLTKLTDMVTTYLQTQLEKCDKPVREVGERYIPLTIWNTSQFQNWYRSQRVIGNQLVNAKLLWKFMIDNIHFTFSYALHVNIWIKAENRVKSNEFIISRPDISVVVPYWKHPFEPLESEIILIREFRSPARTKDGFVHELPGGSNFQEGNNHLQLASNELYEETSLKIDSNRFRYIDSKQLVATWSTHVASVYAVKLEEHEIKQLKQIAASGQTFGNIEDTEKTYVEIYKLKEVGDYVDWSMEGMIYRTILYG